MSEVEPIDEMAVRKKKRDEAWQVAAAFIQGDFRTAVQEFIKGQTELVKKATKPTFQQEAERYQMTPEEYAGWLNRMAQSVLENKKEHHPKATSKVHGVSRYQFRPYMHAIVTAVSMQSRSVAVSG